MARNKNMAMTITEKILARAAGKPVVEPGENVWAAADVLLSHDVCGPGMIGIFRNEFGDKAAVWDGDKVVFIPDHYIFTADEKALRNIDIVRSFARERNLPHFYDPGTPDYRGVCHVALPQLGHVRPGEVIFGTDSHTCTHGALGAFSSGIGNTDAAFILGTGKLLVKVPPTLLFTLEGAMPPYLMAKDVILRIIGDIGVDGATYCAMEFAGDALESMNIDERMTVCNMAVEAGAKNGIMAPDQVVFDYVRRRTPKPFEPLYSDHGARHKEKRAYKLGELAPCVAEPHSPANYAPAAERSDVRIDRAYIGSCTGGKLTDFRAAASILDGRKVAVETFLVPATTEVAAGLETEKINGKPLLAIFREAGCIEPAPPSCAACLGGPEDTFGRTKGREVAISTTNRNFIGRMGSKDAPIFLASPLTVAASAVKGRITDPRVFM